MANINTWFALYTRPRFEFKVFDSLVEMGMEAYLPTYKTLRRWSDRKKKVELPLFPSYCFVKIDPNLYTEPLKAYGVVKYVWFNNKPVPVPDNDIDSIKTLCDSGLKLETVSMDYERGQQVVIESGPLKGLEGEYIEHSGKTKLLIKVDTVNHGVLVSVDHEHIAVC